MANNKSMLDQMHEVQRELERQGQAGCFAPPKFPPLLKPAPEELLPDQEEMDKLASKLTEAVLQLRAGDMKGARATFDDADGLCGVILRGTFIPPVGHHLDALRYGSEMVKYVYQPPERVMTATEQLLKQQIAERQMRQMVEEINNSISSTLYPPAILSDNTTDPTTPGS